MSEIPIAMEGGTSVRLKTAGKYCDKDIVVTATGVGEEEEFAKLLMENAVVLQSDITHIREGAFEQNKKLKKIVLPKAETIGIKAFSYCTALEEADLSVATIIPAGCFQYTKLKKVDLGLASSIGNSAFSNARMIKSLILRKDDTICQITKTALKYSSIEDGGAITGYVYIPKKLVNSYKGNSTWSTYAERLRALEDYTVDGTITGELDESKI